MYGSNDIPFDDMADLARKAEELTRRYEVKEERVEVALALLKPDGFVKELDASNAEVYTAEIFYPKDREELILSRDQVRENAGGFGFHYEPYNFDSRPERAFFEALLAQLSLRVSEGEDISYTGALTEPDKTDFFGGPASRCPGPVLSTPTGVRLRASTWRPACRDAGSYAASLQGDGHAGVAREQPRCRGMRRTARLGNPATDRAKPRHPAAELHLHSGAPVPAASTRFLRPAPLPGDTSLEAGT